MKVKETAGLVRRFQGPTHSRAAANRVVPRSNPRQSFIGSFQQCAPKRTLNLSSRYSSIKGFDLRVLCCSDIFLDPTPLRTHSLPDSFRCRIQGRTQTPSPSPGGGVSAPGSQPGAQREEPRARQTRELPSQHGGGAPRGGPAAAPAPPGRPAPGPRATARGRF